MQDDAPISGQQFYVITADNQMNALVAEPQKHRQFPQSEMPAASASSAESPRNLRSALTETVNSVGQFMSNIRNTKH
ncbi:hypothetical protein [Hyphococcus lacteus]|uniref:Uncharacterized protein n=1 Tax=Hyphococcus lacteus TaxID=3143536 RepID=A0ABV3Z4B1_9PROT